MELPPDIGELKHLVMSSALQHEAPLIPQVKLFLGPGNRLSHLPHELFTLSNLMVLSLCTNPPYRKLINRGQQYQTHPRSNRQSRVSTRIKPLGKPTSTPSTHPPRSQKPTTPPSPSKPLPTPTTDLLPPAHPTKSPSSRPRNYPCPPSSPPRTRHFPHPNTRRIRVPNTRE